MLLTNDDSFTKTATTNVHEFAQMYKVICLVNQKEKKNVGQLPYQCMLFLLPHERNKKKFVCVISRLSMSGVS